MSTLRSRPFWHLALPFCLLALHAAAAIHAASRLSPVWDEIVYPAAGYSYWHTGRLALNPEHGLLSKLIVAAPLVFLQPDFPEDDPSWKARDAFRFGYQFMFHNRIAATKLIFWSRMPAVLFSVFTGLLLFLWVKSLWGFKGGLISLACYAMTPVFLARASLALIEMPMYFFILLSLVLYDRFNAYGQEKGLVLSGVAMGLAMACKILAAALIPAFFIMACIGPHRPLLKRFKEFALPLAAAGGTLLLLYVPWGDAFESLQKIAANLRGYSSRLPFFFHGRWIYDASPLLSWGALLLKAPLGVGVLAFWGMSRWRSTGYHKTTLKLHEMFVAITLLMIIVQYAVATVQMSAIYLPLAVMAGALGPELKRVFHWKTGVIGLILILGAVDMAYVHPNYVSYFNLIAGGTKNGFTWLSDSDQDWGQSLPALAAYQKENQNPPLLLSYSGPADPRAYNLKFQDLFSPALYIRDFQGSPIPFDAPRVWVAMGAKVLQTEAEAMAWLTQTVPLKAIVGSTFLIYDVSEIPDACTWLERIYKETNRPERARWAVKRRQWLLAKPHG